MDNLSFSNNAPFLPTPDQTAGGPSSTGQSGGASGVSDTKGTTSANSIINALIVEQGVTPETANGDVSSMGMDAESVFGGAPGFIDPETMMKSLGNVAGDIDQIGAGMKDAVSGKGGEGKNASGKSASNDIADKSASPTSTPEVDADDTNSMTFSKQPTSTTTTTTTTTSNTSSEDEFSFTQIMADIANLTNQEGLTLGVQQTAQIDAISAQANATMKQASDMIKGADQMLAFAGAGVAVSVGTSAFQVGGTYSAAKAGDEAETRSMAEGTNALSKTSDTSLHETETATNPATHTKDTMATAQRSIKQMKDSADDQLTKGAITPEQAESFNNQADASQKALDNSQYQQGGVKDKTTYSTSPECKQAQTDLAAAKKAGTAGQNDEIKSPEDAVKFYNNQARGFHAERTGGASTTKPEDTASQTPPPSAPPAPKAGSDVTQKENLPTAAQGHQGAPGEFKAGTTDDESPIPPDDAAQPKEPAEQPQAEEMQHAVPVDETPTDPAANKVADDKTPPPPGVDSEDDAPQSPVADDDADDSNPNSLRAKAKTKSGAAQPKAKARKMIINKDSEAWRRAYDLKSQKMQIYAGSGTAAAQMFNAAGQSQDQIYQAYGTQASASAQVEGSTEQAMASGISQTESLAEQLRNAQTSVAQSMVSAVAATRV